MTLSSLPESERVIDLGPTSYREVTPSGAVIDFEGDEIIVDLEPGMELQPPGDHNQNLAEVLDETELSRIAARVLDEVEQNIESRKDWQDRLAKGIRLMGVTEDKSPRPFNGASAAVHPMLAEACVQFQARAIAELWPSEGPVKGVTYGNADEEIAARAQRGEDYLNYQYTEEMPEAFWEMDKLLFRLPMEGSAFKKVYVNALEDRIGVGFVEAEDLIVPYTATDLRTAPGFAHRIRYYPNDMRKLQHSGFYRHVDLGEPADLRDDDTQAQDEIDASEGRSASDLRTDRQYEVFEYYGDFDLPGFEHADEMGEQTGIGLPYIITVEAETQKVLAIRRNWREGDQKRKKRVYFIHYKFLPGLGFYGFGFLHTIGGLSQAATGALRALLDAAQLSNLRGGFKSKEAKIPGGDTSIQPGEWKDTESSAEELRKAFFPIDYKEPSPTLFQLLGFLVESGQRFASTTESMVGDADNSGPVGTTIALIEQGSKVFSGIHKRLHKAQGEEFKLVADLNYEILPPDMPYPYMVAGDERLVIRDDFDGRVDWCPVSDPNIFSSTQRIAMAQAVLELATREPGLYDKREAHERMLTAMKVPDWEKLIPKPAEAQRLDPVSENMAILNGKPVRAFYDQDHEAHIMVHMQWFKTLPKEGQEMMQSSLFAHVSEHLAYGYRQQIEQQIGAIPYMPNIHAGKGERILEQEVPPEMEAMIARAAAQASQGLRKMIPEEENSQDKAVQAEIARKDALAQSDMARKDMAAQRDQERKDMAFAAEQERENTELVADLERDDIEARARMAVQAASQVARADQPNEVNR